MVLGIQWLSHLGLFKWDFGKLLMDFDCGGQPVKLKGVFPR